MATSNKSTDKPKAMTTKPTGGAPSAYTWFLVALLGLMAVLFHAGLDPDMVQFSNDAPLGAYAADWQALPGGFSGMWYDLNTIGVLQGAAPFSISSLIRLVLGALWYSKIFVPLTLLLLGSGAWFFLRSLKFTPLACALGGLAVCLNSTFFSAACWGVGTQEIALGMNFFALGLIASNSAATPLLLRWIRLALAGLAVGINVMEAADIGALCSVFIAGFAFFKALTETDGTWIMRAVRGVARVMVIAIFAGIIAWQAVTSLVGTQIEGIAGTGQDAATKAANWDKATQWSLPKTETLSLIVPGLFGYRMDTPNNMMPAFQNAYRNGNYWGGMGRTPELDRLLDSGKADLIPPGSMMRFSGGGSYCGILVCLLALWAMVQSFRRQDSPFSDNQKKFIWFWTAVVVVSIPLAWGRFAPMFYGALYQLPYFSTIRNPVKFSFFAVWALTVLFAYGVQALSVRYLTVTAKKSAGFSSNFDRKWAFTFAGFLGASILGWVVYSSELPDFIKYLQKVGFADEATATALANFSLGQVGWFVILMAIAVGLIILTIAGYFAGARAKLGALLLGAFLVFDLSRADLPWIIHWDYKQKYEIGTLNPIETALLNKPYEQRVAKLLPAPLSTPSQFQLFDQLYGIEWTQHHFLYYNIQCLDIIQMPRMPEDLQTYMSTLRIGIKQNAAGQYMLDEATFPELARFWELSNTRYLLGPAAFVDLFNAQFDPGQHRFSIKQRFTIALKPGVTEFHQKLEELTAYASNDGEYALIEFAGALPRAKLYANWQVNTNDTVNLKTLADLNFDPAKTVLISTPQKDLPPLATNENSGTVEFKSYTSKDIVFNAQAAAPSVLLLNDKYDPHWTVTVDGQPAPLLRCNYIMRGVYLPAGHHTVEFKFGLPRGPLYVTLTAIGIGFILLAAMFFLIKKSPGKTSQP